MHGPAPALGPSLQHAFMYPAFIVSGAVDLLSMRFDVPAGTSQLFLSLCFLAEGLLFGLHKKHTPMDILVHQILFYAILACALFCALEAGYMHNPLFTAGRIGALYLQAAWFFAAARMMFESHTAWDPIYDTDVAPVWYMPLFFLQLCIIICIGMITAFLLGFAIYRPALSNKASLAVPTSSTANGTRQVGSVHADESDRLLA